MNFKEAAYRILKEEKRPLTSKELTDIALSQDLISSEGKTPHATMSAEIYRDISRNREQSPFVKVDKGVFGLRGWDEETRTVIKEPIQPSTKTPAIAERLNKEQYRSDSPGDFENTIKDAFSLLGFESELIGGAGDTDVLLTANIGKESFKVSVDGKTSKSGKIIDRQIDWISLGDHKKKN